jgi:predicted RNA binding protein YcfA (HicA-like mRNA interferase family)
MPKIPGVNHLRAVKALEKAGFRILRQGKKHIVIQADRRRILFIRSLIYFEFVGNSVGN